VLPARYLVASVAKGGREHTDRAVLAAKAAHADGRWRRRPSAERAAVLHATGPARQCCGRPRLS
jgi:acyl-CoA reductase-like NAD-dependent aldehyde dehydrogenase